MAAADASTAPPHKRLYLSRTDKRLAGVCGGIAEYFEVDPTIIRLTWLVLTVLSGIIPGILAYLVAAVIMPQPPKTEVRDATPPAPSSGS